MTITDLNIQNVASFLKLPPHYVQALQIGSFVPPDYAEEIALEMERKLRLDEPLLALVNVERIRGTIATFRAEATAKHPEDMHPLEWLLR